MCLCTPEEEYFDPAAAQIPTTLSEVVFHHDGQSDGQVKGERV